MPHIRLVSYAGFWTEVLGDWLGGSPILGIWDGCGGFKRGMGELKRLVTRVVDVLLRLKEQFPPPCSTLSTQTLPSSLCLSQRQVGVVFALGEGMRELGRLVTSVVDVLLRLNDQFPHLCLTLSKKNLGASNLCLSQRQAGVVFALRKRVGGTLKVGYESG